MAEVRNLQERRKKARKALAAFGKRARAACEKISTPDEFYEMINPLERILEAFGDDMPGGMSEGLQAAMNITDPTREGVGAACEGLTSEINSAHKILPKGGAGLEVEFNGQSLAGQTVSVNLGGRPSHLLVVRC